MRQARLDRLDEACLNLGSPSEPWSVHLEVRVEGSLEPDRLREAIRQTMLTHPIARARIADWKSTDFHYWWLIPDEPGDAPLTIVDCPTAEDVANARADLQSHVPDLQNSTFEVVLAQSIGGDYLMLNLHHAAGDGMSSYRLMNSFIRNYAGQPDPVPDFDAVAARDVEKIIGSRKLRERLIRGKSLLGHLAQMTTPCARIAPSGEERPGYRFELLRIPRDESAAIMANRPEGATVNDLILGALTVAIRRWNDARSVAPRRIAITMPVNIRPKEWQYEVIGNFASYVTAHFSRTCQADLRTATQCAYQRTAIIKRNRAQGIMVDLLNVENYLPAGVKALLSSRPIVGDRAVDTAMLSNLGLLKNPDVLGGRAVNVTELWFSPPCTMPMGVGVGTVTIDGEMFLTVRYRHPQFDEASAAEFTALFHDVLQGR